MSLFLTPKQKKCGKRGHGYVANYDTGEIVSGCVYCGAYSGTPLGLAARSIRESPIDVASKVAIILCLLALSAVSVVCAMWLGAAL